MNYYCYVYNDENGVAYYVGKGVGRRAYKGHNIPIPKDRDLIQMFYFATEEECWDTEIQLIAFYGRKCDGGTLLNISTGGPGSTGVIPSKETRAKMSRARTGRTHTEETRAKISRALTGELHPSFARLGDANPCSRHYLVTCPDGQILSIHGLAQFCRERGLSKGNLSLVASSKRSHHKGYTVERIEAEID